MAKTNGNSGQDYYEGPVMYVGEDGSAIDIDGNPCYGGWHYSVVVDEEMKQLATEHAQAHVDVWEKRAGKAGIGRFAQGKLAQAQEALRDVQAMSFHVPGVKLHLEDTEDGSEYRFREATDGDTDSWHDRKHQNFATFQLEDQSDQGIRVNEDEMDFLSKALKEYRDQKGGGGQG